MLTTFPRWKYALLAVIVVLGLIYALPNIYGEDPAVQVMGLQGYKTDLALEDKVKDLLKKNNLQYKSMDVENDQLLIRFVKTETQIASRDLLQRDLGDDYSVALNLAPATPSWLEMLGANPMKLGLDLRGGVRFVMDVDVASNLRRRLESIYSDLRNTFRQEKFYYTNFVLNPDNTMSATFGNKAEAAKAQEYINKHSPSLVVSIPADNPSALEISMLPADVDQMRNYTMEQTATTLRNRVNELGVAEALIQREGSNRIVVELPGIQDTARAKDILGKTATLDFMMEDSDGDILQALQGRVAPGSKLYYSQDGHPFLLKNRTILSGDSIVGASSQISSREGKPAVVINLGGGGTNLFKETTMNNIGKHMAVVYRETTMQEREVDGKMVTMPVTVERVISFATIQGALGNSFEISGLTQEEARDLALLLRAGSLPATVSIVEERVIGPSMGQENINKGITSVVVGFCLILVFMTAYYSVFGVIANIALFLNLILLLAVMSLIGATLTLPGIAGIVLTLGMAVDANVLIFERIREELRNGFGPHASIQSGFEHAFATIVDSNLTTLIVGIILYAVGTGPVKGFAVTLSIGILTSLFTAVTATRAIVELIYGKRQVKKLLVGI
ncbi:MAG TPA: protein translocase subunit SecD [Gammaproteobacteria bacterium]|nr:protein translocase subunit SecD [Gammaproteobacteria bacterium]